MTYRVYGPATPGRSHFERRARAGALAALAALGPCGCGAQAAAPDVRSEAQSILGGALDAADPAVVALVTSGQVACSGFGIAPRAVLTAGHCAALWPDEVRFGEDAAHPTSVARVASVLIAPGFSSKTLANDVGVLVLEDPAPAFLALGARSPAADAGRAVRMVGFGVTAADAGDVGRKREGEARVVASEASVLAIGTTPASACNGDSGGPVFLADDSGAEALVGVVSSGDSQCAEWMHATLVSAFSDFVTSAAQATADAARGVGERCFHSANCRVGSCYSPPEAGGFSYCSSACAAPADCPAGMACAGGACRYASPSPGAVGASCATDSDCATSLCAPRGAGLAGACSRPCLAGGEACPEGTTCQAGAEEALCLPSGAAPAVTGGGCQASARRPRGAPWVVLALAVALYGLRRRRTSQCFQSRSQT